MSARERTRVRQIAREDAASFAAVYAENDAFLSPYDPPRPAGFSTISGQRQRMDDLIARREAGVTMPLAILDDAGEIAGSINISNIFRGPFQSCSIGYWVAENRNGRGYATQAVGEAVDIAFEDLDLHRVEAGTLTDNVRSQRVLQNNGFVRIGLAPAYLYIDHAWRDHVLFQRTR